MCAAPSVLPSTTVMVSTVYPASRIQGFVPAYLIDLNEDHTSIFMALDKEQRPTLPPLPPLSYTVCVIEATPNQRASLYGSFKEAPPSLSTATLSHCQRTVGKYGFQT